MNDHAISGGEFARRFHADVVAPLLARAMPGLVPYRPDDPASEANRAAWQVLAASSTPMLIAFSDGDPITGGMRPILERTMAGAAGREHPVIADAGHFLQEDAGPELAAAVVDFVGGTPA